MAGSCTVLLSGEKQFRCRAGVNKGGARIENVRDKEITGVGGKPSPGSATGYINGQFL